VAWIAGDLVMSKELDLREYFESWPYDPEHSVRLARGADGREIMQVRQPLGIEQYEVDGRPDGLRPHGMESVLEYHMARLARAKSAGEEDSFRLSADECAELFSEGVIYYYRYVNFFQVKDWARTVRDTARNLRLFDFVHRYAAREEDRTQLEQWRPYILRMNAVARVMAKLDSRQYDEALQIARGAVERIEALADLDNPTFKFERERSLAALHELIEQIGKSRPVSELERLQQDLARAVETEQFERAAQLRDRIRALRTKAPASESAKDSLA
jgi:hypothetical protein